MSLHHSVFVDGINMFIRYCSEQCILEISVIATEMVSTTFFFSVKKLFLWKENLTKFHKYLLKAYTMHTFKFHTGFFLCFSLTCLVNMA